MALPTPVSQLDQDPVLQKNLDGLRDQAKAEAAATIAGKGSPWMMPEKNEWDGDLSNLQDIEKAFSRKVTADRFIKAISDPSAPGTTGDLIVAGLQTDYLAVMERAFRARHTMGRQRAICHAMGRKRGHGSDAGPLSRAVRDYIRSIINEMKKR